MMNWVRSRKLGHGSFATVNLAIPRNDNAPLMAVKTCADDSRAATLANEKLILDELKDCPEIIKCYGDCFTYENNERFYNLLLEFAPNGTLYDKLRACSDRRMSEREVMRYTKALLKGLRRIHGSGYVHCDIKLQNILLFGNGGLKIADFGLARKISAGSDSTCELRGTPLYMSPEMFASGDLGPASDVWALGCIVVEMLAGAPLWRCSNLAELVVKIGGCHWSTATEQYPIEDIIGNNVLSDVAKDFINKCLVREPRDRWTVEMLLSHPFVCGEVADDEEEEERSKENCVGAVSTSPRCVFDFPEDDHVSSARCSITSLPSRPTLSSNSLSSYDLAVEKVKALVDCDKSVDWSVSDDWVTVR